MVDENGELVIFTEPHPAPVSDPVDSDTHVPPLEPQFDPAFARKSQLKQLELLLSSLRKERLRSLELQTKNDYLLKEYKEKL